QLRAKLLRERSDRIEVRPLTVNRAFDVGSRSRTELRLDDSLMGLNHEWLLCRSRTIAFRFTLLQDRILSYPYNYYARNGSKAAPGRLRARSSRACAADDDDRPAENVRSPARGTRDAGRHQRDLVHVDRARPRGASFPRGPQPHCASAIPAARRTRLSV